MQFNAMSGAEVEPLVNGADELKGASLSGHERDHLFLSNLAHERQFTEVSGISGLDNPADGRAFGSFDYDHDGYLDVVVVNANAPWVTVFRNQIGDLAHAGQGSLAGSVALRFQGGNRGALASSEWSNRDGYGALVTVELADGMTLIREHRAGEGFSAQNSATMMIGVGHHASVSKVKVRWPSGKVQELSDVAAGSLLIVHEDPARAPDGAAFERRPYPLPVATPGLGASSAARLELPYMSERLGAAKLNMFSMMATWCGACRAELPELVGLREHFGAADLAMYGFPADVKEDAGLLASYDKEVDPVYELLTDVPKDQVAAIVAYMQGTLGTDALPQTVVTDARGHVLLTRYGAPSVSELKRLLDGIPATDVDTLGGSR